MLTYFHAIEWHRHGINITEANIVCECGVSLFCANK